MVSALDTADLATTDTVTPEVVAQDIAPETQPESVAETESVETTETATPTTFDSLDDETLDRLYKERGREDRIRESERQKTEARLKRESGNKESTKAALAQVFQAVGIDPTSQVDGTTIQKSEYLYELAKSHAANEIAKQLPEVLIADFNVPVEYRERAVEEYENGRTTNYVKTLLEGAMESQKGSLSLKDVPEGSTLRKDIDTFVAERVKNELKAAKLESNVVPDAPTPPRGGNISPLTRESISSMSPAEINSRWEEVQTVMRG